MKQFDQPHPRPASLTVFTTAGQLRATTGKQCRLMNSSFGEPGRLLCGLLLLLSLWAGCLRAHAAVLDNTFNPGAQGNIFALAVQADGKILIGGDFTSLGGQTRNRLGRLNADGTLDGAFNPGVGGEIFPTVYCLAVQADGKILVGGEFTTLGGQSRSGIGRLNADGTVDTTFNPGVDGDSPSVYSLALQADGKILVGGGFTSLAGLTRNYIGRLNTNGTLDTAFNPNPDWVVFSLAVQTDGKILVGGEFETLGGQARANIGRLNATGSLDTSFNPGATGSIYPAVYSLALQADGKILVGGDFTTLGGQSRNNIGRLNSNGTLDTFNPEAGDFVESLAVQTDGKILVGGAFTTLAGQTRTHLGRVNADGSLDGTFNPTVSGSDFVSVSSLAPKPFTNWNSFRKWNRSVSCCEQEIFTLYVEP